MARHDQHWETAGEVESREVVRGSPTRERNAFVRFLAGGDGWQQASRQLSGAFAEPPSPSLNKERQE